MTDVDPHAIPFGGVGQIREMMFSEGWLRIGDNYVTWHHPPSARVLSVWRLKRRECGMGCWGPEPEDRETEGYSVTLRVHDDLGNPIRGDGFWVQDYDTALTLARKIRREVLADKYVPPAMRQMTLDEAIDG